MVHGLDVTSPHHTGKRSNFVKIEVCRKSCSKANLLALLCDLKTCSRTRNLETGKTLHAEAIQSGLDSITSVASALICMYAKCGCMLDARLVFDSMKQVDVVSWSALILGYAENGQGLTALDFFMKMRNEGIAPDSPTFLAALKACISFVVNAGDNGQPECRDRGKVIHNLAVNNGCNSDIYVQTSLINMYAKCGIMMDAFQVFESIKSPNVVSWNVLILGYVENGQALVALHMFVKMKSRGTAPNSLTFLAALKACSSLADIGWAECMHRGKIIHDLIIDDGCDEDVFVQGSLIHMYAKLRSMVDARQVFNCMKHRDAVSWNVLILGYAENGQGHNALDLFTRMQKPDYLTFIGALKTCISLRVNGHLGLQECRILGKNVHNLVVEKGWDSDIYVQNTLIDMYAKLGNLPDTRQVFDMIKHPNVVSWNVLILGYAEDGQGVTALDLFTRMWKSGSPMPSSITLVAALKACACLAVKGGASGRAECKQRGKEIHELAMEKGCNSNIYVQSTLIDMYSKCGSMVEARDVLDSMKHADVVCWTALILGYAEAGEGGTALELFTRMKNEGLKPDSVAFSGALKACALLGALEFGRTLYSQMALGNHLDMVLVTCLVDFYAKCGDLVEAQRIFDMCPEARDMISWNALLSGYSGCGDLESVFKLFTGMQDAGFQPDSVTFLCILACCSHSGLVHKAKECFDQMSKKYRIIPSVEHYTCMVDILGRANKFDNLMHLLRCMPSNPNDVTWMTALGACRKWKNVEIGRLAFQALIRNDDGDAAAYLLMGIIYKSRGMLQEHEIIMGMREKLKAQKKPMETSWTNEVGEVHRFTSY